MKHTTTIAALALALTTSSALACDCKPEEPKPPKEPPTVSKPRTPDTNSPAMQLKVCDLTDPARKAWWDNRYCPDHRITDQRYVGGKIGRR